MSDLPPLDAETRALLDHERERPDPSADRFAIASQKLTLRVALGEGATSTSTSAQPKVSSSGGAAAATSTTAIVSGLVGAVIGAAVTFAVMRNPAPPSAEVAPTAQTALPTSPPPIAPSVSASAMPTSSQELYVPPKVTRKDPLPAASPEQAERSGSSLTAERAVLDEARAALRDGDAARALDVASRHAKSHPRGQLTEEREAIAVRALLALGRRDEAKARAADFHQKFPTSPLGRSIDAILAEP